MDTTTPVATAPAASLCDIYQTGYADGKAKTHVEVQSWTLGAHATDCGCDVCVTVRLVLQRAWPWSLWTRPPQPSQPASRAHARHALGFCPVTASRVTESVRPRPSSREETTPFPVSKIYDMPMRAGAAHQRRPRLSGVPGKWRGTLRIVISTCSTGYHPRASHAGHPPVGLYPMMLPIFLALHSREWGGGFCFCFGSATDSPSGGGNGQHGRLALV